MSLSKKIGVLIAILALGFITFFFVAQQKSGPELIFQPSQGLPITVFNLSFRVGSADDPQGSEGLAYLTGRMIREGGVNALGSLPARGRAALEDFLFPLASDIDLSVAKEQTSLTVTTASDNAELVFEVMTQLLLAPAFQKEEFERIKAETLDLLTKQFPREDQEELGKAALDQAIYSKTHPYGHVVEGTVAGVQQLSLEQVEKFYRSNFTQTNLTIGAAGVVSKALESKLRSALQKLPQGTKTAREIPEAKVIASPKLTIVEGPFEATGVHLGQGLPTQRGHEDFGKLYLAATAFGKHRSFVGRLMKEVREVRGLNYGAYAYVEDYPFGGRLLMEPLNVARTRQAFTVWARPTSLPNGCFLLRQVVREVSQLSQEGLTPEEFKLGQSHLLGYVPLLGIGLDRTLGYAIDAKFYGMNKDYLGDLQKSVEVATETGVKAALNKYIKPNSLHFVVVTPDAKKFQEEIFQETCGITYPPGIQKPEEVLAKDKEIAKFPLGLKREEVSVLSAESVFAN